MWLEEKTVATKEKIESWKAQQEVKRLDAYAKLAALWLVPPTTFSLQFHVEDRRRKYKNEEA